MILETLKNFSGQLYPYWQILLCLVFVGIVAWSYWPSAKRRSDMQDHAEIPLRDDIGRQ